VQPLRLSLPKRQLVKPVIDGMDIGVAGVFLGRERNRCFRDCRWSAVSCIVSVGTRNGFGVIWY
jgi:hypothetical protein